MEHEWTRMRPYQDGRDLKARVVCARCPAEKRFHFNATTHKWEELPEGRGLKEACPITL